MLVCIFERKNEDRTINSKLQKNILCILCIQLCFFVVYEKYEFTFECIRAKLLQLINKEYKQYQLFGKKKHSLKYQNKVFTWWFSIIMSNHR